jgi:hypothetical protein
MVAALRRMTRHILLLQLGAVLTALTLVAFAPPVEGRMILVPVIPGAAQGMIARATRHDALLVDYGPLPGSFVIEGNRAALWSAMLSHGVVILAAPPAGCGANAKVPA